MSTTNPHKNRKRPHRNNFSRFRAKAKRYSKSGSFGRGTNIDDNDCNYFINILDSMKNGFEDVEEKELMARNALRQTNGNETYFACNQIVSKALEALIGFGDDEVLERYFTAFFNDLRPLCSDPFASHVLQKLLEIAFLRSIDVGNEKSLDEADKTKVDKPEKQDMLEECNYNLKTNFKMDHRQKCIKFVERVAKFLLNNLEDFVWDNYGSHIMRTAIYCLAGIHIPKVAFQKANRNTFKNGKLCVATATEWHEVIKEYAERLSMWPQFSDLPYEELTSALLGVICMALHKVDKKALKHFGTKLLNEAFLKFDDKEVDDDNKLDDGLNEITKLPKVFLSQPAVNLLETLLNVAGPKVFTQVYAKLFSENLEKLALEYSTNFAVQRLIDNVREKSDFEKIVESLTPHFEKILEIGNTGILAAMSAACLRLSTKQAAFVNAMQTALHVKLDGTSKELVLKSLLKLKPKEVANSDESAFIHLHGSVILQNMLKFNKPIVFVNWILETPAAKLCEILSSPNGSHIINAFFESKYIGEKSREKLIRHLENFYVDLAPTKFGSRVIDCIFEGAQAAQKERIIKALAEKMNLMASTPFGRILDQKFMLSTYRLSPAQWKQRYQKKKEEKAEDLFKDIIN